MTSDSNLPATIVTRQLSPSAQAKRLEADILTAQKLVQDEGPQDELSPLLVHLRDVLPRMENTLNEYASQLVELPKKVTTEVRGKLQDELSLWMSVMETGFAVKCDLRKLEVKLLGKGNPPQSTFVPTSVAALSEIAKLLHESQKSTQTLLSEFAKQNSSANSQAKHETSVKLPTLQLPVFDGNVMKYTEFWDIFKATVDGNPKLSDVEKLSYLKDRLKGKALDCIKGLPITNASYGVAKKNLQDRFGNPQQSVEAHYEALMKMPNCSSTTTSLRSFYDSLETHLRSLEALAQDTTSTLLVTLVLDKIPKDVKLQLELKQDGKDWSVQQLRAALSSLITAKERAEGTPQHEQREKKPISTGQALLSNGSVPKQPKCIYCQKAHYSDECSAFKTIDERKKELGARCFICLKAAHLAKDCHVKRSCYHCKRKSHHRSLCPEKFAVNRTSPQNGNAQLNVKANEFQPKTSHAMVTSTDVRCVLMQTAVTTAIGPNGEECTVRILFDTGASRSYVNKDISERLHLTHDDVETISVATFGSTKERVDQYPVVHCNIALKSGGQDTVRMNVTQHISSPGQKNSWISR